MDPIAYQAAVDQNAAALRDAYDLAGVDLYDEQQVRAIQATIAYLYGVWTAAPHALPWGLGVVAQTVNV
jgi:hypothetical protein